MARRGVNKVFILGNAGNEPEFHETSAGNEVCKISVETSSAWTDKGTGQPVEKTEWHRVTCFGTLADRARQSLHKGSSVYVEGRNKDPRGKPSRFTRLSLRESGVLEERQLMIFV